MNFQKGLIITGPAYSGKSTLAKGIASRYSKDEVVYLDAKIFKKASDINRPFTFQNVKKNTKLLVVDEIIALDFIEFFAQYVTGKLTVEHRGSEPFEIQLEKIVICCFSDIKAEQFDLGPSMRRRFDLVELKPWLA